MTKFHINPEKGPMPCTAQRGQCLYGPEDHFATRQEAQGVFEERLKQETKPLTSLRKTSREDGFTSTLARLDSRLESASYEEICDYADTSRQNHGRLEDLLRARATQGHAQASHLTAFDPKNPQAATPVSPKTYKVLREAHTSYRDQTAIMVEAYLNSRFHESAVHPYSPVARVGQAVPLTSYAQEDPRWYTSRYNTLGGSDIGGLVLQDFFPEEDLTSFDRLNIYKLEKSKTAPPTLEDATRSYNLKAEIRRGPLYRGTVWEGLVREDFARENPALTVYATHGQYAHPERPWQRVNFDGLYSDAGEDEVSGLLEVKTGSVPSLWDAGPPPVYRAQALYYLNATGLNEARVRALLNDAEVRDFRLTSQDEVVPGCGLTMEEYMEKRVIPWWEDLQTRRPQM